MILLTALAGGIGAALRFIIDGLVARRVRSRIPVGTLLINVTGSFLLGLMVALATDHSGLSELRTVLGTGLLGGYTTFSTASVETVNLARGDGPRAAAVAVGYAALMLVLGLAAGWLGFLLG